MARVPMNPNAFGRLLAELKTKCISEDVVFAKAKSVTSAKTYGRLMKAVAKGTEHRTVAERTYFALLSALSGLLGRSLTKKDLLAPGWIWRDDEPRPVYVGPEAAMSPRENAK